MQLSEDMKYKAEYRSYSVLIGCGGSNRVQNLHYEIRATGYSPEIFKLEPKHYYFLRGSFFPTKTSDTYDDEFFFEGSDRATPVVEESMQFLKKNPTDDDLVSLYAIVQHCDFHPETKDPRSSTVEYRIPPFKHLSGSPKIVKNGRECQFHGYVKDFNEETNCYIVIVAPTSGHVEVNSRGHASKASNSTASNTRPQIVKFNPRGAKAPFRSPLIASYTSSSIPFPPSDRTASSLSSGSGTSNPNPIVRATPPAKKRQRAQPKRKVAQVVEHDSTEEV
ncbi:uncharacterized protein MELLADRAFT_84522 [Melampsora larici-populina 98AG31]|uniref:Uncharacterized protein n=1 Tax=Melampsora larici-populina (strain 98AG31 / pathotype 3-4-7) TaxID=747676 RepID=F4SCB6_MELLP|nr:uncharacterized protein MELLADRAFT_84522 [Melampsora larici-populina 98AG31]EGF97710.1 hypothetical protein MELLADRAFT_84522 [Melampsora larici-populina 98AG31]